MLLSGSGFNAIDVQNCVASLKDPAKADEQEVPGDAGTNRAGEDLSSLSSEIGAVSANG